MPKEGRMSEDKLTQTSNQAEPTPVAKKRSGAKDMLKCTLVLAIIAAIAGLLLGVMNYVTYQDPDSIIIKDVAAYFEVAQEFVQKDEAIAECDIDKNNRVQSCFVARNGDEVVGYCFYTVGSGAKDGAIELMVYIGADSIIKEITVYAQGETAGYFDRVQSANKPKYVGLDISQLQTFALKKGGASKPGEVDAVSSATYTSVGYHNAIAAAVYAYKVGVLGGDWA